MLLSSLLLSLAAGQVLRGDAGHSQGDVSLGSRIAANSSAEKCVWTWVAGPDMSSTNATASVPAPRCCAASWQYGPALYMWGGANDDGYFADMWKFDSGETNPVWARVKGGVSKVNFGGNKSFPAGRTYPITWKRENPAEDDVEFWMFGGDGCLNDTDYQGHYLGDMWHWSMRTGTWTQHHPVGPKPQNRTWGNFWSTQNGDLAWVHTGVGPAPPAPPPKNHSNHSHHHRAQEFNDMWLYNVTSNKWTLIYRHNNTGPSYHGATANPGARDISFTATTEDQLWLVGGSGQVTRKNGSYLAGGGFQDVWKFNTETLRWKHIFGPKTPGQPTVYGTQGVPSATNLPPPIHAGNNFASPFKDQIWMMGGENGSEADGMKNGLWSYDIGGSNMWTWQSGNKSYNVDGHYGTRGVGSSANTPGARYAGQGWITDLGLWLFGGYGVDANKTKGYLSDTWNIRC